MRTLALENRPAREAKRTEREPAKRSNDGRPLIVIDPGHGGPDTGTVAASGEMEKTIVLEFAQTLSEKLEKSGKYRVLMTRTDDRFVPLGERVRFARHEGAALFVSIHADALAARGEADVRGATVYTLSDTASDAEAARLAEDENKADAIAGVDLSSEPEEVADILIDLTQRETKNFSHHFARTVVGELKTAAKLHKQPAEVGGLQGAEGARRALGADRARLRVEQAGPQADDLGRLAHAHQRGGGAGGEYLLLDPARGFRARRGAQTEVWR